MPISSPDYKVTILPETTFGVVPATGSRYDFPRTEGNGLLTKDFGAVESTTIRPGRNSNGARRGNQSVSGTLDMNAITAPLIDLLIESALSGKFVGSTLKAGQTDSSFTHIAELAANTLQISSGCMVTSFTLTANAAEGVSYSFDITGVKQDETDTFTGTFDSVTIDDAAYEYLGDEVLEIVAAGATNLKYSTLTLTVGQERSARNTLSSDVAFGLAASGARTISLEMSVWREPGVDYSSIFNGEKQEFSFNLGPAGYGRKYTTFGQVSALEDVEEDDLMVNLTVNGAYDSAVGTALTVEKL